MTARWSSPWFQFDLWGAIFKLFYLLAILISRVSVYGLPEGSIASGADFFLIGKWQFCMNFLNRTLNTLQSGTQNYFTLTEIKKTEHVTLLTDVITNYNLCLITAISSKSLLGLLKWWLRISVIGVVSLMWHYIISRPFVMPGDIG